MYINYKSYSNVRLHARLATSHLATIAFAHRRELPAVTPGKRPFARGGICSFGSGVGLNPSIHLYSRPHRLP